MRDDLVARFLAWDAGDGLVATARKYLTSGAAQACDLALVQVLTLDRQADRTAERLGEHALESAIESNERFAAAWRRLSLNRDSAWHDWKRACMRAAPERR